MGNETEIKDRPAARKAELATTPCSGFFRARVEVCRGNRQMCDFVAAADLGLTGFGVREVMTVNYKPGETVDEARVLSAFEKMQKASDAERTSFKILSYRLLSLTFVPNDKDLARRALDSE